jgi:hypothetical protein
VKTDELVIRQLKARLAELDEARRRVENAKSDYESAKGNCASAGLCTRNIRIAKGELRRARYAEEAALNGVARAARLVIASKEVQDGRS